MISIAFLAVGFGRDHESAYRRGCAFNSEVRLGQQRSRQSCEELNVSDINGLTHQNHPHISANPGPADCQLNDSSNRPMVFL